MNWVYIYISCSSFLCVIPHILCVEFIPSLRPSCQLHSLKTSISANSSLLPSICAFIPFETLSILTHIHHSFSSPSQSSKPQLSTHSSSTCRSCKQKRIPEPFSTRALHFACTRVQICNLSRRLACLRSH